MEKYILGVSGEPGSFSEEAGLQYADKADLTVALSYLVDMEGVLAAIDQGKIDLGIFPVVNSIGGLVSMAFEAMGKYLFVYLDQLQINVNQCLMARAGLQLSEIRSVVSHPQGFAQSEVFLKKNLATVTRILWQDTAKAARELASGVLPPDCAVIASAKAAKMYQLEILAENIQGLSPNLTTFIIVKKAK
ncbi:MAG: chorismate mutase [Proteobacteria bacterium]|nr:chorismate mutase [Pseudomonadota bacterium]